jgi:hypothetical protein
VESSTVGPPVVTVCSRLPELSGADDRHASPGSRTS